MPDLPLTPGPDAQAPVAPSLDAAALPEAPLTPATAPVVDADAPVAPVAPEVHEVPEAVAAVAAAEAEPVAADDTAIAADGNDAPAADAQTGSKRQDVDLDAVAAALKQHFPALFGNTPKPMKLRIQTDIQARAPGVFTKRALGVFFHRYTGSTNYLIALSQGTERFDLDGQPAGELSEEHRNLATEEVARRRALRRERDQQMRQNRAAERGERGGQPPAGERTGERGEPRRPPRGPRPQPGATAAAPAATGAPATATDGTARPPRGERPPRADGAARGPRAERGERNDRAPRGDRPARPERGERTDRAAPRGERPPRADRPNQPNRPDQRPQRPDAGARPERAPRHDRPRGPEADPIDSLPLPADPAERAAVEARRQRAALLRDFETSPLSPANFCVLKRLSPADLEAQLAQARSERAERSGRPAR